MKEIWRERYEGKRPMVYPMLGKKHSEKTKQEMRKTALKNGNGKWLKGKIGNATNKHWKFDDKTIYESRRGNNNYRWLAENADYRTKHKWIQNNFGKATFCEICDKIGNGHQIHWCNIDHKYRRKREDYFQACAKCHGVYDKINKLRKNSV